MKTTPETGNAACTDESCAAGSCGGPGLCPGVAIFLAYAAGGGIAALTGLHWLGWAVGVPLAFVLLTGVWRWLPGRRRPSKGVSQRRVR